IASVLSNARYKAVLIPCIALVLSIIGLTAVAIMHDSNPKSAANTTGKTETTEAKPSSTSPDLNGADKQTPKDNSQAVAQNPNAGSNTGNESASSTGTPNTATNPSIPTFDFALSKSTISINRDSTTGALTATSSDNSEISWSITSDRDENSLVEVIAEKNKDVSASYSFKLRAAPNAAPGQYQFTVTATDTARNIRVSKQIVLTVNS
ncbi:MAG: hypothetical protein ABWX94_02100, partial [Candidatus Saccharimonadales bacterium]